MLRLWENEWQKERRAKALRQVTQAENIFNATELESFTAHAIEIASPFSSDIISYNQQIFQCGTQFSVDRKSFSHFHHVQAFVGQIMMYVYIWVLTKISYHTYKCCTNILNWLTRFADAPNCSYVNLYLWICVCVCVCVPVCCIRVLTQFVRCICSIVEQNHLAQNHIHLSSYVLPKSTLSETESESL